MNYFTHGLRFVDRPWFVAGTAAPDWMSVADRRVRFRDRRVGPFIDDSDDTTAEFARGVLQHLADDQWFHQTPAFFEVTGRLTRVFRDALPSSDDTIARHRPSFLGHIGMEMLLDAALIERFPQRFEAYYAALASLDGQRMQAAVNRMCRDQTTRLAEFFRLFCEAEFLRDYADDARILYRLNQVLRRVKLHPLPDDFIAALGHGREIVRDCLGDLLPAERFVLPAD